MAILGEIRKRIWILFVFIGLAMFAFLFNPDQWAEYFKTDPNIYGKVENENISRQEFGTFNNYLQNQTQGQIQDDQVWNVIVQNKLIAQKFDQAGMKITEDNFWNYLQYSSAFANDRSLYDQNGNFDYKPLKKMIDDLAAKSNENQESKANYQNWLEQKKIAEYEIKSKLYFSAITKGLLVNNKEVKNAQKISNEFANIEYVGINYDSYNQKEKVTVTDQDINDYIKKYPKRFKTNQTVDLKYVVFENKNTPNDDSLTLKEVKLFANGGALKDENGQIIDNIKPFAQLTLEETPNIVDEYSDVKFNRNFSGTNAMPEPIKDWVKTASTGAVLGPYEFANYYIMSKLMARKTSDSTLTKHILISYKGLIPTVTRTKEQAKKLADSISNIVSVDASKFINFINLSDDKGSAQQGGIVGWTTSEEQKFLPEFQKFVNESPKGKIGIVETQVGFHIIEIADKKSGSEIYQVANLAKERKASSKTTEQNYNKATAFAQKVQNSDSQTFISLSKKNNYNLQEQNGINRFTKLLNGINPQSGKTEELLSWAFNSKTDVNTTNMFTTATGDHYIVLLNAKNQKGLYTAQMARSQVETIIRNQKLAQIIITKIGNNKSLDAISKQFGTSKKMASLSFQNSSVPEGNEPKINGVAFGIKPNTVSNPIEGKTGVYILVTKNISKNQSIDNSNQIKDMLKQQFAQSSYNIIKGIENISDVEDTRIEANQN